MAEFELPEADYTTARAAFTAKKDEASKKVEDLKKQLGTSGTNLRGKNRPIVKAVAAYHNVHPDAPPRRTVNQ